MRSYYRLCLITLIAVYILILVGGIVRSTGSGMGCPDWPRCFGQWVPPTSVDELPDNYKEIYSAHRDKKNVRFARYLSAFGFSDTASKILSDETIREESDFNPTKTMIEYLNRVVGVIIGFLIFAVFVRSIKFWKWDKWMVIISLLTFLLVGFQGWIGSFVVSTNLTPWTITVHMFLAMLIVFLLVYLVDRSRGDSILFSSSVPRIWLVSCIVVLSVQILLGTQLREAIDQIANKVSRDTWIANVGGDFIIHRSFSWVVLILHAGLVWKLVQTQASKAFSLALILLILATLLTGSGMAYFGVPPFLQPVHLLLATLTFGFQAFLLLQLNRKIKKVSES